MENTVLIFSNCPMQMQAVHHIYETAGFRSFQSAEALPQPVIDRVQPDVVVIAPSNEQPSATPLTQQVRSCSALPIIVAPQFYNEHEEMSHLAAGADDYVSRERSHRVLLMRTESLINRSTARRRTSSSELRVGKLSLNPDTRTVHFGDTMLSLTRTEFDVLALLMHNNHRVVHREELLNRVWGNWYGDDHILEVHVSRLRRKITDSGGPRIFHPVRSVGYRLLSYGQSLD